MYLYIAYLLKYLKNPNFIPGRAPFESLGLYHHQNSLVRLFPRFEPRGFHLLRVTKLSIENWHEKELIIDGHIPRMMYLCLKFDVSQWHSQYKETSVHIWSVPWVLYQSISIFHWHHGTGITPKAHIEETNQNSANVCRCKWPSTPTLPRIWEWVMG